MEKKELVFTAGAFLLLGFCIGVFIESMNIEPVCKDAVLQLENKIAELNATLEGKAETARWQPVRILGEFDGNPSGFGVNVTCNNTTIIDNFVYCVE